MLLFFGAKGTIKLFKLDDLDDDDVDLPVMEYIGLSKHEFFDAMLLLASVVNNPEGKSNEDRHIDELYKMVDEFCTHTMTPWIYLNIKELRRHVRGKKIHDDIKHKVKDHSEVIRLFKKYATLHHEDHHHGGGGASSLGTAAQPQQVER